MEVKDWKEYLKSARAFEKGEHPIPDDSGADFTARFCESKDEEARAVYIACGFNPIAFFGFARYKAGEITFEAFRDKVIPIINKE